MARMPIDELGERRSLRDAARRTTQAGVEAAKRARDAINAGVQGVREGLRPAATATTSPGPAPRTANYGTDRASQRLRAADAARAGTTSAGTAASPAGAVGPNGTPVAPEKVGGQSRLRRALTPSPGLQTAGRVVGKVAKLGGRFLAGAAPITAGVAAVQGYNTPTEEYAKRYGEKAGESFVSDLGLRARGVGEDLVNALNPFSDDTFGTRAKPSGTTLSDLITGGGKGQPPAATQTPNQNQAGQNQADIVAANNERGRRETEAELGPLRSRITQTAPNSFTNTPDAPAETDIGKPGGGLSVVDSLSPERVKAISEANADLQEAREAASIGISQEQYQRQKAQHQRDSEIANLQQGGLSRREATASLLARDTALAKATAQNGLDAGNLISLLGQQQDARQHAESLGVRRNQLDLNERIADDQTAARERTATAKLVDQLNSDDPGVASSTRGRLLQTFRQNPGSPEGRLLLSQAAQALRQRSGDERGPIDAVTAAWDGTPPQFPGDLTTDNFSLEPGVGGQGVGGTIVKDGNGAVLGNLDDLPAEYAEAIKHVYALRNEKRGLR